MTERKDPRYDLAKDIQVPDEVKRAAGLAMTEAAIRADALCDLRPVLEALSIKETPEEQDD